jgi:flavorubredoxin
MINKELEALKFDIVDPGLRVQYIPDKEALKTCYELGRKVGKALSV